MIALTDISISLDLTTLIIVAVFLAFSLIVIFVKACSRGKIDIDGIDFGLDGISFHVCNGKAARQIAYKIWVEINTRVIGVKIDLEKDIIRSVHDSYYTFFTSTRLLIEDIPANNVKETRDLVILAVCFLNDVMRPYLTKWGIKYNEWYDKAKEQYKTLTPQKIQKHFKEYDEMVKDLLTLNQNVISYSDSLRRIAFKEKKRKNKK